MGAGQSTAAIDSATAEQKEKVGRFVLRKTEEHTLTVLNDLLNYMLEGNNLFDLAQVLNTQEGCAKLFTVLSSTVKKEFMSIKLPDPSASSESRMVSSIMKDKYAMLETEPIRKATCEQIAWFIIRLVTFVAALTASVTVSRDLPSLLFTQASGATAKTLNPTYKNPVINISGRSPIRADILEMLTKSGALRAVTLVGESEKKDSRDLYFVFPYDSVIIDAHRSIVYMGQTSPTGVFGINFEVHGGQYRQMGQQQQMAPAYGPAPAPLGRQQMPYNRRNNNTRRNGYYMRNDWSTTTRSTAGTGRYMGGKTRRRRLAGGNYEQQQEVKYLLVTIRNLVQCESTTCQDEQFIMDFNGQTFEKREYEEHLMRRGPIPIATNFADRMKKYIGASSAFPKVSLEEPKEEALRFGTVFAPLFKRETETYSKFKSIKEAIEKKPEGVSPASYRAFLLASELDGQILNTLFCTDGWAEKRTTDTVAYSLLNALYIDRPEGVSESSTANELSAVISTFTGAKALSPYVKSGGTTNSFENVTFREVPKLLNAFCGKISTSGKRGTQSAESKKVLTDAHKVLRTMYDEHLKAVVDLIRKALSAKTTGYRSPPYLELDARFRESERGAIVALEELIAEARKLLSNHYLAVEKVYNGTLAALVRQTTGNYVAPKLGENRLNKIAEELEN